MDLLLLFSLVSSLGATSQSATQQCHALRQVQAHFPAAGRRNQTQQQTILAILANSSSVAFQLVDLMSQPGKEAQRLRTALGFPRQRRMHSMTRGRGGIGSFGRLEKQIPDWNSMASTGHVQQSHSV